MLSAVAPTGNCMYSPFLRGDWLFFDANPFDFLYSSISYVSPFMKYRPALGDADVLERTEPVGLRRGGSSHVVNWVIAVDAQRERFRVM